VGKREILAEKRVSRKGRAGKKGEPDLAYRKKEKIHPPHVPGGGRPRSERQDFDSRYMKR